MKRVWDFFKSLAWIVGFMVLVISPLQKKLGAQQRPLPQHVPYNVNVWGWPIGPELQVTEYSQPFIYSQWWAEIAICEGFPPPDSAAQHSVQFFSVPSSLFAFNLGTMLAGTFDHEPAIYMGAPYVWEEAIVKHEMLHMILRWAGFEFLNYHPADFFEKCGIHTYATPHS